MVITKESMCSSLLVFVAKVRFEFVFNAANHQNLLLQNRFEYLHFQQHSVINRTLRSSFFEIYEFFDIDVIAYFS